MTQAGSGVSFSQRSSQWRRFQSVRFFSGCPSLQEIASPLLGHWRAHSSGQGNFDEAYFIMTALHPQIPLYTALLNLESFRPPFTDSHGAVLSLWWRTAREIAMKPSLLLVAVFFVASSAQAQSSHAHMQSSFSGQGGGPSGLTSAPGPSGSTISTTRNGLQHEPPRNLEVGYAKNDGKFVPSTFMNYNDAVALGKQQMAIAEKAAQGGGAPSLGDVARGYRPVKITSPQNAPAEKTAQDGGAPSLGEVARAYRPGKFSNPQATLIQGDSDKLEVCDLNGTNCHRR